MDVSNGTWVYIGGFNFRFDKCNHVHSEEVHLYKKAMHYEM
jgi:hypothetical protein